jgi:uncharacterized protein
MELIDLNIKKLKYLCKKHHVLKLFVFGSVLNDKFNSDSDVDFIVEFKDIDLYDYADNYFSFKFSLEEILNREVDLLEEKALKNPYLRKALHASRQMIYG